MHIFSKEAFRFPNANNYFYFYLLVKDTNLKPDILEPVKDTLEVELGKVAGLSPLIDAMLLRADLSVLWGKEH